MSLWRQLSRGLDVLFDRASADQDVSDEIEHFLDATARARGLSADEARRAARLELGSVSSVRQEVRDYGWENLPATVAADLRFAVRLLRRSPIFTVVAVVAISLGSGAVTTIYSAMNALVLRPLPGTGAPARLVDGMRIRPGTTDRVRATREYYEQLRDQSKTLVGAFPIRPRRRTTG